MFKLKLVEREKTVGYEMKHCKSGQKTKKIPLFKILFLLRKMAA